MYYSIDDIERDGTRIPTEFQVDVLNLEFLNKNSSAVGTGERFMLPMWLAVPLASTTVSPESDTAFITIEEPEIFSATILNAIKTDPLAMDLRAESSVFTQTGIYWANLWGFRALAEVFYYMIRLRSAEIYDRALAQIGADPKYDEWEKQLYKLAHLSRRDNKLWLAKK